ncbi:MAG: hypothetical protein IJV98_03035 [Clostridia bacterium]|nr:hypothetical protein [Clostridia bacterium]
MKKSFLIIIIFLLILCFASCGKTKNYLNLSIYDKEFMEKNQSLFLNEDCLHAYVYMDARDVFDTIDHNVYHGVRCKWSDCGLKATVEPHTMDITSLQVKEPPSYQENGYLYHRVYTSCTSCKNTVILNIYCPIQNENCTNKAENRCLAGCDWEEILCDTPYVISDD